MYLPTCNSIEADEQVFLFLKTISMISIFVIVVFISILVGMAISVSAFGTGGK